MSSEAEQKIITMLDLLSVEVAEGRLENAEMHREIVGMHGEIVELRTDMNAGFHRIDRRFDRLELRVETLESDVRDIRVRKSPEGSGRRRFRAGVRVAGFSARGSFEPNS